MRLQGLRSRVRGFGLEAQGFGLGVQVGSHINSAMPMVMTLGLTGTAMTDFTVTAAWTERWVLLYPKP